jgi:hypothetical protein
MRSIFQRAALLLLLVVVTAATTAKGGEPPAQAPAAQAPAKPGVLVTISKETTYITEPLRQDGYPDYIAALNQRASQGVTPENNAAVLFWKAMGPGASDAKNRERRFQMLGILPLPEKGNYFIPLEAYAKGLMDTEKLPNAKTREDGLQAMWAQLGPAMERPWSKQELPLVAGWLEANERPLALLLEASKRPRRYDPLVGGEKAALIDAEWPAIEPYRAVVHALVARSTLRVHEGKVDDAWEDLLACRRLARLVGQDPMFATQVIFSLGSDHFALAGDRAILQHPQLSAAQIAKMRDDLTKLPPIAKMADAVDIERFMYLDGAAMFAREGLTSLKKAFGGAKVTDGLIDSLTTQAFDWDLVLRTGNSWYDRSVDALRKPTRAARTESANKINPDFMEQVNAAKGWKSIAMSALLNPREGKSQRIALCLLATLLPDIPRFVDVEDRGIIQFELTKLAFALAAYRVDNGSYPAKLAELTPKYVADVPKDVFSDAELHYAREGDGHLLYSVGVNGKDDGGKTLDDAKEGEDWDDLVVRMPTTVREAAKP